MMIISSTFCVSVRFILFFGFVIMNAHGASVVNPAALIDIFLSPCSLIIFAMDYVFISYNTLQNIMLMANNRQLVIIDTNLTHNTIDIKLQKLHHPITTFTSNAGSVQQFLVCRNGLMPHVNNFKSSWVLPFTTKPLDIERQCNNGLHPLLGTSMKGLAVDPMNPHNIADFSKGKVTGGIAYDIFEVFTKYYKISFDVLLETDWITMNEDGTLGGEVGNVVSGDFDFTLDMPLNMGQLHFGLGKGSSFTYYLYTEFLQMKPKQKSAANNMMHSFDIYTWIWFLVSLNCVTITLYFMRYTENKQHTISFVKMFEITFGNIFQEYKGSSKVFANKKKSSSKLNLLWIIVTMLLSMSFVGNLKSILMRKQFEPMAKTKAEIVDMNMRIRMRYAMEPTLEAYASENQIDKLLLCQARKSHGFYDPGDADLFYKQVEIIQTHNDAGVVDEASVNLLKKQFHQQGKNFPYVLIPDSYIMFPMGMLFKKADYRPKYFNDMITKLYDSGLIDKIFNKWKPLKGMKEQVTLTEDALTFEHLILPIIFFSAGILLSATMLAAELGKKKCLRH